MKHYSLNNKRNTKLSWGRIFQIECNVPFFSFSLCLVIVIYSLDRRWKKYYFRLGVLLLFYGTIYRILTSDVCFFFFLWTVFLWCSLIVQQWQEKLWRLLLVGQQKRDFQKALVCKFFLQKCETLQNILSEILLKETQYYSSIYWLIGKYFQKCREGKSSPMHNKWLKMYEWDGGSFLLVCWLRQL